MSKNILWTNKETFQVPKLISKRVKASIPVIDKASNSWYLNVFLIISFIIFGIFFLLNCRSGIFQSMETCPLEFYQI
jgi:hypothetical protein